MNVWQLQKAKSHLSEMVRLCVSDSPQTLTVRGKEEAILLSKKSYDEILSKKLSFIDFIQSSPLRDVEPNLERDKSQDREVNL